jgi:hypothetical protein
MRKGHVIIFSADNACVIASSDTATMSAEATALATKV